MAWASLGDLREQGGIHVSRGQQRHLLTAVLELFIKLKVTLGHVFVQLILGAELGGVVAHEALERMCGSIIHFILLFHIQISFDNLFNQIQMVFVLEIIWHWSHKVEGIFLLLLAHGSRDDLREFLFGEASCELGLGILVLRQALVWLLLWFSLRMRLQMLLQVLVNEFVH